MLYYICFAAYDIRSIDELLGCTVGRLGYIRPATACDGVVKPATLNQSESKLWY
jgi:hypothetical protein